MTEADVTAGARPSTGATDGRQTSSARRSGDRRWRSVLLAVCGGVLLLAAGRVALTDPRDMPVSGDQAAFVLQAVSIADGNLSYDERDQQAWLDLGWEPQPRGLFVQRNDDGWAFAKPYGYSLLLAPFVSVFGAGAITIVGAGLLLAYAGCWYAIGRQRWDRATAAAVATVAAVGSHALFFAFPAHADLFVAVIVGLAALGGLRAAIGPRLGSLPWLCIAAAASGLLVTEKFPALVAVGPLLAVAWWRSSNRARVISAIVAVGVVALSIVPYLYYSDGDSWSAYGGDRYYAPSTTPWSGGTVDDLVPWRTRESLTPGHLVDSITDPSGDLASATLTYAVGRHTGAVVFQPIVGTLAVAVLGGVVLRRRRRPDDPGEVSVEPSVVSATARSDGIDVPLLGAAAVGVLGYAAVYLVAFTDNYFGGGQSIGNRYFLQVSCMVAVFAVAGGVSGVAARWSAAIAAVAAAALLTPQLLAPSEAFSRLDRTSTVQRVLPFDGSQESSWMFSCAPSDCVPPPVRPFGED